MLNFDLTGGRKRGSNHQRVLACWGGRVLVLNLWRKTRCSALQRRSSSLTTPSLLARRSPQQQRVSSDSQLSSSKLDFTILRPIWFAKIESRRKRRRNYASLGLSCSFCLHRPQHQRKCRRQSTRLQRRFAPPRAFPITTARLSLAIKPVSSTATGQRELRAIALLRCSLGGDHTHAPTK